ncbi:MAG: hypothetical protein JXX14_05930 [Deltaproteobacteria bacterium]|nr:hypothetical protein [Deltaproteobacteria bacterium]
MGQFRTIGKSDVYPVKQSDARLFLGGVIGRLSFRLSRRIHIPLTLGLGVMPKGVEVRFAQKRQATLNTLLIEASLGVAVRL